MSFRQLFDRMNRYTRSHSFGGFGRTNQEELRRAEELIEAERRRDERERQERERQERERREYERSRSGPSATSAGNAPVPDSTTRALYLQSIAALSVADGASWEEITAAYRRLITIFHPDRTSRLAPAEREQAHRRTQEINIAYGFLTRYHGKKP